MIRIAEGAKMTMSVEALDQALAQLDADIPLLMAEYGQEFWAAFAGQADVIEDAAGVHAEHVAARIDAILTKHGLAEH
jgi:hypothetical protein